MFPIRTAENVNKQPNFVTDNVNKQLTFAIQCKQTADICNTM